MAKARMVQAEEIGVFPKRRLGRDGVGGGCGAEMIGKAVLFSQGSGGI